ncbi:hypothetical protein BDW59DRAFT_149220 [Aspergillus cavernicola]|uniref:Xylanolytic transcriptional activator regulatory domain-containing protein n=1 Tax=Aspergillus cavernicola TaxID=176166 RepID=A0ABR4I4Y1_9EURO
MSEQPLQTPPVVAPDHTTSIPTSSTDTTSNLIRQELASHAHLSLDRVWVLESALGLVGNFVSASQHAEGVQDQPSPVSNSFSLEDIPSELFYMLLHDQGTSMGGSLLHWPDHISSKTLERMCVALSSRAVHGQVALRYSLCVLSKAAMYVSRWLRFGTAGGLIDSLGRSRKAYITASLRCLKEIDFSKSPSLSMLQALLSGASLVQLLGETSRSWFLTAIASRVLVSLGYHQSSVAFLESDGGCDIRHCVYWCYYMDKTLSMLLVRPSSLPSLRYQPSDLVHEETAKPLLCKVKILVRLAHVQDRYLDIMFQHPKPEGNSLSELVDSLHSELTSISKNILKYRSEYVSTPTWEYEWDAVNFTFCSIATTVLRLNSLFLHDHRKREECLEYARNALRSMQTCQKHIYSTSAASTDSLIWTVLLYPLTPFFVLFCNVVASSNIDDLDLLNEATVTISNIQDQCAFSMNIQHLLAQLTDLCSHLDEVKEKQQVSSVPNYRNLGSITQGTLDLPRRMSAPVNTSTDGQILPPVSNPATGDAGAKEASVWDDGLLWELFNIQPSVEWFDVDYCNLFEPQQPQP